jgi:hypothetical protein
MRLGDELRSGPVSFRQFFAIMQQSSPSFGITVELLIVVDHLGEKLPIPFIFCSTWKACYSFFILLPSSRLSGQGLDYMVKAYSKGRKGDHFVERGDYRILQTQDDHTLTPEEFDERARPGMAVEMSIVLRERITSQDFRRHCPQCGFLDPTITAFDRWITW